MAVITMSNSLSSRERRFVHIFVLTLAICFSPFKPLAALVPFIFIAGLVFYAGISSVNHLLDFCKVQLDERQVRLDFGQTPPLFRSLDDPGDGFPQDLA